MDSSNVVQILQLVALVVLGLVLLARLQDALNLIVRELLNVPASPLRLASQGLGASCRALAVHRGFQLNERLGERHDGKPSWAMIGAMLYFVTTAVLIGADYLILKMRVDAIFGSASDADGGSDLSVLFGLIFAALCVQLVGLLLDRAGVTFLTPYLRASDAWRRRCLPLVIGSFIALLVTAGLLAVWAQINVNTAVPETQFGGAALAAFWSPNADPTTVAPTSERAPAPRNPVADAIGYVVLFNVVALGLIGLAIGKWSLGEGPLAIYVIALTALLLIARLMVRVCQAIVLFLDAVRRFVQSLIALPAELGRTLWNQLGRWPSVRRALNRARQEIEIPAARPVIPLMNDNATPLYGFQPQLPADGAQPRVGEAPMVRNGTAQPAEVTAATVAPPFR